MIASFRFMAPLWEWEARDNWFFVSLPADVAEEIMVRPLPPRGFGSVSVRARVGATRFATSIFPSDGTYVLPIKRSVREAEGLEPGGAVTVELELV